MNEQYINSEIEYLAIPYSDKSEDIREFRANIADYIWYKLTKEGRIIFSPISGCHNIAKKYKLPTEWSFWRNIDFEFLKHCKKIIVVQLEGWEKSVGVTAEIEFSKLHNIPIEYCDPARYIEEMENLL